MRTVAAEFCGYFEHHSHHLHHPTIATNAITVRDTGKRTSMPSGKVD